MRGTVQIVPLIVVIARRDSRRQEHDFAIETLTNAPDDRRGGPTHFTPTCVDLPAWHEHEEDD